MTDQREWNIQLIQQIFSSDTAQVIINLDIHPREEESIHWKVNNTRKFSVKALYKSKIENLYRNDQTTRDWRAIWNLEVAPAVKNFLWKCAHEILPTNAKTASILHYIDSICKLCNYGEESMTHMFLNCPAATEVWQQMLDGNHGLFDHHTVFMDWFNDWFHNANISHNVCIYATTCWFIWKARCDLVFQNISPNAKNTTLSIQQHLCDHNKIHKLHFYALNTQGHIIENESHIATPETIFGIQQHKQSFGFLIKICTIQDPSTYQFFSALTITDFAGNYVDSRGHT
ncbi:uncharacterized protein LOC113354327 [Papaver somniferum]|uniref:uncharacterized protein LOC113354327 n=1 Tax=Papaver somniferum TaxID=3469 RepID=UPI000E6F77A7|nr:uncharacterized protein LOC113354327 [Papaver somniferum]